MNILICSQWGEFQVEEVVRLLKQKGYHCVLFERYRKDQYVSYQYKENHEASLQIDGKSYALDSHTFPVVWYRPKPILFSELPGESGSIAENFCSQEWRVGMRALQLYLQDSHWVIPIENGMYASSKPYQLKLASQMGLLIPHTVITNNAHEVRPLFDTGRVIYKTLSSFLTAKQTIFTNEIRYEDIVRNEIAIAMAPGIFQQYIEKEYELRITIIGEKLFIVRINSQKIPASRIDWRRKPHVSLYEMGSISAKTHSQLLRMHKKLGLVYAAYDFIVDKHGREIFIECNPSGQWLWLENALDISVSQMMVDECVPYLERATS